MCLQEMEIWCLHRRSEDGVHLCSLPRKTNNSTEKSHLLSPDFNVARDDPFVIAPFTSTDFKADMMTMIGHHWNLVPATTKEAWKDRATQLNFRPSIVGQFHHLPDMYLDKNSPEELHKIILKKDLSSFIFQMGKKFKKYQNVTGLYNKKERVA